MALSKIVRNTKLYTRQEEKYNVSKNNQTRRIKRRLHDGKEKSSLMPVRFSENLKLWQCMKMVRS